MKSFRFLMAIAIVSMAFVACISDDVDDDKERKVSYKELTAEEQQAVHDRLSGEYTTYVFFTDADKQKTDSVLVHWEMNPEESTATCTDFPVYIFRNYVVSDVVKDVLKRVDRQPITFKFTTDPVVLEANYNAEIFYYPLTIKDRVTFNLDEEGKEYAAIEFSTQFTSINTIYTQMAILDKKDLYGVLLVKVVEANQIARNVNLMLPFQTPYKKADKPADEA